MRRLAIALLSVLIITALSAPSVRAEEQTKPTPYPEKDSEWPGKGPIRKFGWMVDNRNYFWTQRAKDQGAIVFIGDSLTGNWKDQAKDFPKFKVVNHGIGGDTSRGVLFRFKEDVLDLNPKAIHILVGTNDLTAMGKPEDAASNVNEMLAMVEKHDPNLPVIVCSTPLSDSAKAPVKLDQRKALNEELKKVAAAHKNVTFVDLYPYYVNDDNSLKADMFAADRLHFGRPAYIKWAEVITPILEKVTAGK